MDVTGNITTLIRLSYRFESYQYYKLSNWTVSITSDITLNNLIPIKRSRLFKTFFVAYFHPVFLDKNNYTFCNVFDNKEEFDEAIKIIKKYYKTNFRV